MLRPALLLSAFSVLVAAPPLRAQPRGRPVPPAAPLAPDEAPAGWDLNDRDALLARINASARSGSPRAAEEISRVLLLGVEPAVAQAGLEALATLGRREGAEAVGRFLLHRRALLRRHAVIAARSVGGPELLRGVEARLSDPDPDVRVEAARTLGALADADALATLWRAVDRDLALGMQRGVNSLAAAATAVLGARGGVADVDRLASLLGRVPLGVIGPGLRAALLRGDLADDAKLRAVRAVAALSTQEARAFLEAAADDYRGRPAPWTDAARTAAARIR